MCDQIQKRERKCVIKFKNVKENVWSNWSINWIRKCFIKDSLTKLLSNKNHCLLFAMELKLVIHVFQILNASFIFYSSLLFVVFRCFSLFSLFFIFAVFLVGSVSPVIGAYRAQELRGLSFMVIANLKRLHPPGQSPVYAPPTCDDKLTNPIFLVIGFKELSVLKRFIVLCYIRFTSVPFKSLTKKDGVDITLN